MKNELVRNIASSWLISHAVAENLPSRNSSPRAVEGNEATTRAKGEWKIAVRLSIIVFEKNNGNTADSSEKFLLTLSPACREEASMHGTAAYFRSDAHSRGRCSRNTSIHYGAHTHARAHARTVFIDLGPGGNTRFMVSSTTRAGSKFQRGGNSAQITTLRIVGLLVIQLSNPPSFSFFFFLFLSNRKNSFEVVATPEIIF